jgi:hypothetical protein
MARAYSDDLRRKLLGGVRGEGRELDGVGGAVLRERELGEDDFCDPEANRANGEAACGAAGTKEPVDTAVREQLRGWISQQPDLTLMEMRQRLSAELQLSVSMGLLWTVIREMGLRLKSHSTPPSRATEAGCL